MSIDDRIDSLKSRHATLEAKIVEEENHPHPDEVNLLKLKKQKLAIKDELADLGSV